MEVAVFSSKPYDRRFLDTANARHGFGLTYYEARLTEQTSVLAARHGAVCVFVNDQVDASVLAALAGRGTRLVALRCAGFNNVDLEAAAEHGITVVRVPAYSPYAVAEHTVSMILSLNRNMHRAYNRIRDGNFALEGLLGFDVHGCTAGVVGTGKIGAVVVRILVGLGCRVLAYDPYPDPACEELGATYVPLAELLSGSDLVTLHCPLTPETHHLIDRSAVGRMKDGVMLINTSRGALVDTQAVIRGLKSGKIGYLGLDVYEEEADLFFEDLSSRVIQDDVFARLLTFPNVLITGHQAFFTRDALERIAQTTLENIAAFASGDMSSAHEVRAEQVVKRVGRP